MSGLGHEEGLVAINLVSYMDQSENQSVLSSFNIGQTTVVLCCCCCTDSQVPAKLLDSMLQLQ